MNPFPPIYTDNHLLVVHKPAGMLIQGDKTGDVSLYDRACQYLKTTCHKPGNVFLGIVHRLDRPVSGIVVFARTSKAASRLSDQFRRKVVTKKYWALVEGIPPKQGKLVNWIRRNGVNSVISTESAGKKAVLSYRLLKQFEQIAMLEVDLDTGRHHQIRVQLANIGFPIIGDFRYGSRTKFPQQAVALHAHSVSFKHPVRDEQLFFTAPLNPTWPEMVRTVEASLNANN